MVDHAAAGADDHVGTHEPDDRDERELRVLEPGLDCDVPVPPRRQRDLGRVHEPAELRAARGRHPHLPRPGGSHDVRDERRDGAVLDDHRGAGEGREDAAARRLCGRQRDGLPRAQGVPEPARGPVHGDDRDPDRPDAGDAPGRGRREVPGRHPHDGEPHLQRRAAGRGRELDQRVLARGVADALGLRGGVQGPPGHVVHVPVRDAGRLRPEPRDLSGHARDSAPDVADRRRQGCVPVPEHLEPGHVQGRVGLPGDEAGCLRDAAHHDLRRVRDRLDEHLSGRAPEPCGDRGEQPVPTALAAALVRARQLGHEGRVPRRAPRERRRPGRRPVHRQRHVGHGREQRPHGPAVPARRR